MTDAESGSVGWTVVIPVKSPARGKSRLAVDGTDRVELARAMALDTIAAAAACDEVARVVVVTDDAALALHAGGIRGLRWIDETASRARLAEALAAGNDTASLPAGLNGAVELGIREGGGGMPRAALLGDLPALTPADLGDALRAAAAVARGVVQDADGTGSTLVTAGAGVAWVSAFGEDSYARHRELGCTALPIPALSTLRFDVDTADQLERLRTATTLGPRTEAVLSARVG